MDFSKRADLTEWMDEPGVGYEDLRGCLLNLEQVNRATFAYGPTLAWMEQVVEVHGSRELSVVDVGCGGGDTLRKLARWARGRGVKLKLTGVDLSAHAIRVAREQTPAELGIDWVEGDAVALSSERAMDVVISSLLTHHLREAEIVLLLKWMERSARVGWFINDLERAETSFYLFRALAWAMRWHPFVKHDGPVSIRRAFREEDWRRMCAAAELREGNYRLEHFRPARLCVARLR